jgi:hypothetical protein
MPFSNPHGRRHKDFGPIVAEISPTSNFSSIVKETSTPSSLPVTVEQVLGPTSASLPKADSSDVSSNESLAEGDSIHVDELIQSFGLGLLAGLVLDLW